MKGKTLFKTTIVLALIAFFGFLPLIGGHVIKDAQAKEVVIKVGVEMDQTGPLSVPGRKGLTAWQWYAEYLNDEIGGWKDLEGNTVKLKVIHGDTGFKPTSSLSLYKKFRDEGVVAVTHVGSVELGAIRSIALRDKMPSPTNSGSLIYPLPSPAFGHWADYSACSAAVIDYIKEKWEKSNAPQTKKRLPRLAFIGPEGYQSWAACITPEVMRYAKLKGVDVVGKFFVPMHPIDTKPQVMSAEAKKADFIYAGLVVSQGGAIVRDVYELGLKGDPTKNEDKIEVIGQFPMSPLEMIKLTGGKWEAVQGMILIGSQAYIWEDKPTLKLIRKYAKKHDQTELLDVNYVAMFFDAMLTGEAIKLALQKVPGDKLKRQDVLEGFLRIKDFDSGGVVPSKITFNEEKRIAMEKVRVDRIVGEKGVRELVTYTDYKMLAPIYTEEYAKAHGKKSIYSAKSLELLGLNVEDVGFMRIK